MQAQTSVASLTVAVANAPKTLDPAYAADAAAARLLQLTNPALLALGNGAETAYQPVPLVAQACTQPDLTHITCTLPSGTDQRTFHDGTPLTAQTLAGWFTFLKTEPRSPFASTLKTVTIRADNAQRLNFTLAAPSLLFISKLAEIPLAPSPTSPSPTTAALGGRPGLGAYRVTAVDATGNVTLATSTPGVPPRIVFTTVQDATTRLLKLKQHEVDVVLGDIPPELYQWGRQQGFAGLAVPSAGTTYLGFNFNNEFLADPAVREAITRTIDRPAIRKYLLGGLAQPASSLLPPGHPLAWPAPEEPLLADDFARDRLLDETHFRGPGNIRFPLTLLISTDALSQRLGQVLQQQLAPLGIQVILKPTEWGAFFDQVRQGRFDMVLLAWTGEQSPAFYYDIFHASQLPPGGLNRGRVNDPALNATLEAILHAPTPQQLAQATLKAQQQIAALRPTVPLYRRDNLLLMNDHIQGCRLDAAGSYRGLLSCTKR